jgi:acylphosphatase
VVREIVILSGRVQGVGFRDRVSEIARRFAVAGTVRNVVAGSRLEIDVEGADEEVKAFLAAVLAGPPRAADVQHVERRSAVPRGVRSFHQEATR